MPIKQSGIARFDGVVLLPGRVKLRSVLARLHPVLRCSLIQLERNVQIFEVVESVVSWLAVLNGGSIDTVAALVVANGLHC